MDDPELKTFLAGLKKGNGILNALIKKLQKEMVEKAVEDIKVLTDKFSSM